MKFASMSVVILLGVVGCVPQADYDNLMFQNTSLAGEKLEAEERALNAEAQAEALRNQLRMREREVGVERSLVDNLKAENTRLDQAFTTQQDLMRTIDLTPDPPLIIQQALPAELDRALRSFASSHPGAINYDPSRGLVKWRSDLLFASGSDVVKEDAKSTLRGFADVVNTPEASVFDIVVVGHTDNDPIVHARRKGHPTNWHLSAHRAIAVAGELLEAQITPGRVGVMGYGEYRPLTGNDSKQNKALNRRVEVYIVGQGDVAASTASHAPTTRTQASEPQK